MNMLPNISGAFHNKAGLNREKRTQESMVAFVVVVMRRKGFAGGFNRCSRKV